MKKIFDGVGVAVVTPFLNNKIDFISFEKLLQKCILEGASAIIVLGTTGEGSTVTEKERKSLIKFARKIIPSSIKMIVGTGNNNFEICKKNTLMAKELGADGALVVTPYYNKTTQKGLEEYYAQLAKIKLPIILYNVPSRTGLSIELSTLEKIISTNEYVYGIKESTSDISRIMSLCRICKDKIAVYSGEDDLNFLFYCLGGNGTISVTANAYCKEVVEIYRKVSEEKLFEALSLYQNLSPINKMLFCETNPIPIKYVLHRLNIIESPQVRMPLIELLPENKEKINDFLNNLSL